MTITARLYLNNVSLLCFFSLQFRVFPPQIRKRSDVWYLERNLIVRSLQAGITWNQDRVDQRNLPLDSSATYKGKAAGSL